MIAAARTVRGEKRAVRPAVCDDHVVRALVPLLVAGCGRLSFDGVAPDATNADATTGACPGVAGTQADSDGDGLGDACDPRPSTPGDAVYFHDPFDGDDPRYTRYGSNTYVDGALRLSGDAVQAGQAFFDTPTTVTRIDTSFVIRAYSPTDLQWLGVWSQLDPADRYRIFSEAAWAPGGDYVVRLKETIDDVDRYSPDILGAGAWVVDQPYAFRTDMNHAIGGDYQLTVTVPGRAPETVSLAVTAPPGERGYLECHMMTCDFLDLVVYYVP